MKVNLAATGVVLLATGFACASGAAASGSTPAPVYLDGIMVPAIMRAEKVIRQRPAPNPTNVQLGLLRAKQASALQRLKSALLGRKVVAVFTVTNVVNDRQNGGFDVDGDLKLNQPTYYNPAALRTITPIDDAYLSAMRRIAKIDYNDEYTHPRKRKNQDIRAAIEQKRQALARISGEAAPPTQKVVLHTVSPAVLSWTPGQTRLVFGSITGASERVTSYSGGSYSDSPETKIDGDYVACVIRMHWIADRPPSSLRGGMAGADTGKPTPPAYLDAIMAPAISRAEGVTRETPGPDWTTAQTDALNSTQAAALQRLKAAMLGKKVIAGFTVTDVVDDADNGGFDVDANLNFNQPTFLDQSARTEIASGGAQLTAAQITAAAAPPPQQLVIHTVNPVVLSWRQGQRRLVFGNITRVEESVVTYDPVPYSTEDGGDYVVSTIRIHWVADHAPEAALAKGTAKHAPSMAKFRIVMKNGSIVHATNCAREGADYKVTEFGVQIDIPVARIASVTKLPMAAAK